MTARKLAAVALGILLAGCGYKGPLTLPEKAGPVTIRPGPATPPATPPPGATSPAPGNDGAPTTPPKEPPPKPPAPKDTTAGG